MNRCLVVTMQILCTLLMAGAAIPAVSAGDAERGKSPRAPATDSELDALLTREALRVLRRLQPLEGQRIGGPVRASMDVDTGAITV